VSDDILERAAAGTLPDWAEASPKRRAHMDRVAELMRGWAAELDPGPAGRTRWTAAGRLHDVYRDADAETMRPWVPKSFADLPEPFLHGPAAAARLEAEGVEDEDVLDAIRYHTLGNHEMGRLGRALMVADFLEPGRTSRDEWRASRRERMPAELDEVLADVVRARLDRSLLSSVPLRIEMVRLWNALAAR
jgi:HD superfamily phosphohydrolase YqeK